MLRAGQGCKRSGAVGGAAQSQASLGMVGGATERIHTSCRRCQGVEDGETKARCGGATSSDAPSHLTYAALFEKCSRLSTCCSTNSSEQAGAPLAAAPSAGMAHRACSSLNPGRMRLRESETGQRNHRRPDIRPAPQLFSSSGQAQESTCIGAATKNNSMSRPKAAAPAPARCGAARLGPAHLKPFSSGRG